MIVIPKLDDWRERLDAWVAKSHRLVFNPGIHDCGLNAASAVAAQTGVDFAAEYRGRYETLADGLALLRERGFEDHAALAASVLAEIPPAFAQVGDLAAVDFGNVGVALMVVAGHRLIAPMPHMAGNLPLMRASRAFAVGRGADA